MKKKLQVLLAFSLIIVLLTGCGIQDVIDTSDEEESNSSLITTELDAEYVSSIDKMESGNFYIEHDGKYYKTYKESDNYESEDRIETSTNPQKQMYFNSKTESKIPTLFLDNNDKLIYFSTEDVLDYVSLSRYYDLGYTLNCYNIQSSKTSKFYLDVGNDAGCIITGSDLEEAKKLNKALLLARLGNTKIDENYVDINNIITGVKKDESYDLELYDGTKYHNFLAKAENHVFREYELFGLADYTPLRKDVYDIDIPDYLVTGYYQANAKGVAGDKCCGMFRLVKGKSYNLDETDFNKQLLFTATNTSGSNGGSFTNEEVEENCKKRKVLNAATKQYELYKIPSVNMYSDKEDINEYKTNLEGTLGSSTFQPQVQKQKKELLEKSSIRNFYLELLEDKKVRIKLVPSKNEDKNAKVIIIKDNKDKEEIEYSPTDEAFIYESTGNGEIVDLQVSGIWNSFKIELLNIEQTDEKAFKDQ